MKTLNFKSPEDFECLFGEPNEIVADAFTEGIQEALSYQKKTADIFRVNFNNIEFTYIISVSSSQWVPALEACLRFYEKIEEHDKALETYLLRKEVNKWIN